MSLREQPLVTVLTPVYNNGDVIEECIKSILNQTYTNFEYIIVNNRSSDRTLEVALSYARTDSRVRVVTPDEFVGVIENHNRAFRMMSPDAKYCKVVSGDDWIFPECLERMVGLAEANPGVGLVGCYLLAGTQVMNAGLEYERAIIRGREACRGTLLGTAYIFGSPTSLMYRADLVRAREAFYPNPNPHADTSAVLATLEDWDFGFVHQVLTYARIHAESQTSKSIKFGTIRRANIADVARYGPKYLSPEEMKARLDHLMGYCYKWLVPAALANFRSSPEFWPLQKRELEEVGVPFSYIRFVGAAIGRIFEIVWRPGAVLRKLRAITTRDQRKVEAQYYH